MAAIELDNGHVIRNGEPLGEPFVANYDRRTSNLVTVPEGTYYVLGASRPMSSDSHHWGFMSDEYIIGRAWLSYWPSVRIEFLHAPW